MRTRLICSALASAAAALTLSAGGITAAAAGTSAHHTPAAGTSAHHIPVPRGVMLRHVGAVRFGRPAILIPRSKRAAVHASGGSNMSYNGGAVQSLPQVFIVFWGSWWSSTCGNSQGQGSADEGYLYNYFHAVSGPDDGWSPIMSQYRDSYGDTPTFPSAIWGSWIVDCGDPPQSATNSQLASEASTFANYFVGQGYTINNNSQIIVVSPSGTNPGGGFGSNYCAWHSWATDSSSISFSFTNMPYLPDQGYHCGANAVQSSMDGWSIVGGHEYAESVTDPFLNAWYDSAGEEIGDKCAWTGLFAESMSGGSYAQQPLWDNNTGSCRDQTPIPDNVYINPIPDQSTAVGAFDSVQIQASSSGGFTLSYSAGGLPPGVGIDTSGGLISGSPAWPGNYSVSAEAFDPTLASGSTTFAWRVMPPEGVIRSYSHRSHCVNDNKGKLASGTPVNLWGCTGALAQDWASFPDHSLRRYGGASRIDTGKCMSIARSHTANGTKIDLAKCNGGWRQVWKYRSASHQWVNPHTRKCLADPGGKLANGTRLVLHTCKRKSWEKWTNV